MTIRCAAAVARTTQRFIQGFLQPIHGGKSAGDRIIYLH
jgi:hypothetical protein